MSYIRRPIPEHLDADPIRKVLETPARPPNTQKPRTTSITQWRCRHQVPLDRQPAVPSLPRKRHQRRIERDGQEQMTRGHGRHGQDSDEVLDPPVIRDERRNSQDDHGDDAEKRKRNGELEALEHLGHLDEEIRELGFLGRRAPRHVDLEHVRQQRLRYVQG